MVQNEPTIIIENILSSAELYSGLTTYINILITTKIMKLSIKHESDSSVINLALDTINLNKQALIFVNAKKSAEKSAEEIAKRIKGDNENLTQIANEIINSLPRPTKQCERAAECVKKGIAFHHAGLTSKQREIIEENFRNGMVKIICCTPTLAFGLDLPAYRAIIKDLRRYSQRGLTWIPVLEYLQMAGRAGRPNYDSEGFAIVIAETNAEKSKIEEKYLNGEPEEIYSKLAVEPVLRTYVLSLIASGFVKNNSELIGFFSKTFYAYQYKDIRKIINTISKILDLLEEWEFIIRNKDDFVNAGQIDDESFRATLLGKRTAELYIDPLTSNKMVICMRNSSDKKINEFSFLQMISNTLELRPLLRVGIKEHDKIQEALMHHYEYLMEKEPSIYEPEYEEFLNSIKTTLMFNEWINEKDEEFLLEEYGIRPGEINAKLDIADWMLYSAEEMSKLLHYQNMIKHIIKLRFRMKYGAKEEILPLLRLEGIGRVRARVLFRNKIKDIGDVKNADLSFLKQIIGDKTALNIKKQVGDESFEKKEDISLREWG